MDNNIDYTQRNLDSIDMECDCYDDDDFGGLADKCDARPMKTISVQMDETNGVDCLRTTKNWNDPNEDYSNANEIDMEIDPSLLDDDDSFGHIKAESYKSKDAAPEMDTSGYYGETADWSDDDEDYTPKRKTTESRRLGKNINDDDYVMSDDVPLDDTEDYDDKEYVDESMLQEKKRIDSGTIEDNYYSKLQKKHKDSNVKGSYNTSMHFSYDPEAEMADFNAGFKTNGAPAAAEAGVGDAGGEGCCEDLEVKIDNTDWTALAKALLAIIGFEVTPVQGGYNLHDTCETCPDMTCKDNVEIFSNLKPYIDDCFVYPLQSATGEKFKDCKDWCDWYKGENCDKFPKCSDDIKYCNLIANHINDCKF